MNKLSMAVHQAVSFSSPMMHCSRSTAVFWPGCALMKLEPHIISHIMTILRRAEPGIGLAAACCGQPTHYLQPQRLAKRQEALLTMLRRNGVERIYTACPNCTLELQSLPGFQIISLWPVMAQYIQPKDLCPQIQDVVLHDPCPTRKFPEVQQAVRHLLQMASVTVTEPQHCREKTICCGNYHMMPATAPETSLLIRRRRVQEFPQGMTVTSFCEGCLDAFRSEGLETVHVLELLFGPSRTRTWRNRVANVKAKENPSC